MQHCSPEKTLFGLIAVELLLVALFGVLGAHNDFFHLGREQNLPTWFSSMQLFFAAYCAMIVAHQESLLDEREALLKSQLLWYVMAAGFAFLSLDEFSEIHELIQRQGRTPVWVLVYSPIALLVACYGGYETLKRSKIYPQLPYVFGVACLVMGAGAFGAEWVGNYMPSKFWYGITLVVEEFGEMLGVSILLYGIFLYSQALEQRYSRMVEGQPPHLP